MASSSTMLSAPYRATQESWWWWAQVPISHWMPWSLCWMSTTKVARLWMPSTRNFSNYEWMTKKLCQIGGAPLDISKSLWPHSQKGSHHTTLLNWSETTSTVDCPSCWRWCWLTSRQLLMKQTYSDYLPVARGSQKEDMMETSQSSAIASISKLKVTSFFPLQNLKGSQPTITPST